MNTANQELNQNNYKWMVVAIVVIGTFMTALNGSIVNVSLPAIMADFGVNLDDIQWVVTGYMIAYATLMPLTAWLRDKIGYKILYIASLTVFTIGSILCASAWNLPTLIGSRIIQALGGGAITPTGMAMITEAFEPHERGRALGLWGVGVILGPSIGPTLGGYLTNHFGWRSIFMVNLPVSVIALIAASLFLIKEIPHKSQHRQFDFWGFTFLSIFLIALLLGLSKGEKEGWFSSCIITCAVMSSLGFIGFILVESNTSYGIINLHLFKSPVFSICSIIFLVRSVVLFGGIFLLPLFLQQQMGYDEMQTGLILLPSSIVMAFIMPFSGILGDKIGARLPTIFGLIGLWFFMYMYKNMDVTMSVYDIIFPTLIRGIGMGLLMAPVTAVAMNAVSKKDAGMASSMLSILMQVGGSLGISILSTVLSHRIPFHVSSISSNIDSTSPAFTQAFHNLFIHAHALGFPYALSSQIAQGILFKHIAQHAVVLSFQDSFLIGSFMVAVAFILSFFLPGKSAMSRITIKNEGEIIEEITTID